MLLLMISASNGVNLGPGQITNRTAVRWYDSVWAEGGVGAALIDADCKPA